VKLLHDSESFKYYHGIQGHWGVYNLGDCMKKTVILIIFCLMLTNVSAAHWIAGEVLDAPDGTPADGQTVIVYFEGDESNYNSDVVGESGESNLTGWYMVDAENIPGHSWQVGDELTVKVLENNGYFSDAEQITTTGSAWDLVPTLQLKNDCDVDGFELNVELNAAEFDAGDTVSFSASLVNTDCEPVVGVEVGVEIQNSLGTPIYVGQFTTDNQGRIEGSLKLPDSSIGGQYELFAASFDDDSETFNVGGGPADTDADDDGVDDSEDNCPDDPNPAQTDTDGDGVGDACDSTGDTDADDDGVEDSEDNCPNDPNPAQTDTDGDGVGDACDSTTGDTDADDDGVEDSEDNCPDTVNPAQTDTDGDGVGDACETAPDADGDGVPDSEDNCPNDVNPTQSDGDRDGSGDACDPPGSGGSGRGRGGGGGSGGIVMSASPTVTDNTTDTPDDTDSGDGSEDTPDDTPSDESGQGTTTETDDVQSGTTETDTETQPADTQEESGLTKILGAVIGGGSSSWVPLLLIVLVLGAVYLLIWRKRAA